MIKTVTCVSGGTFKIINLASMWKEKLDKLLYNSDIKFLLSI